MPFLAPHSIYISCCTNFQYNFVTCSRNLCVFIHEIFLNEINNIFDFSASFHCHLIFCPAQMFSTDGCGETSINQYLERGEKKWSSAKKWLLCSVAEPGKLILSGDDLSFRKSDSCCLQGNHLSGGNWQGYISAVLITIENDHHAKHKFFFDVIYQELHLWSFQIERWQCFILVAVWAFSSLPPDIQR